MTRREKAELEKAREMLEQHSKMVLLEFSKLFRSGGINPDDYDDDENSYLLTKVILYAALKRVAEDFKPLSAIAFNDSKSLHHF